MPASGLLFSDYFLRAGVEELPEWQGQSDAAIAAAGAVIRAVVDAFAPAAAPNESVTERLALEPLLDLLGWPARLTQQSLSPTGRSDVPDYLLFADGDARAAALALPHDHRRYARAATFVEAKRWDAPLDRAPGGVAPSTQMLRYLSLAEVQSDQRIRFAILTNGRRWRLYDQKARSRAEEFFEVDLALIARPDLATDPAEAHRALRLFLLFFGAPAWTRDAGARTLHERALGESRRYEERVTKALADTMFGHVFRDLADALRRNDPQAGADAAYLAELREATLIYLYRLLFTLFAEDRRLLPTWRRPDGLTTMREDIAKGADGNLAFSARRANYDGDLRDLWRQIDEGDDSVGVPPYNGGLFRGDRPLLDRARIPDAEFAPILDALSRTELVLARKHINYRDLSVQHLGSVYERLLEFELAIEAGDGGDRLVQRPNAFARKTSGSYYTPEELVLLIIGRTLGPLIEERRNAFRDLPAHATPAQLDEADPASRILDLTVLDPAMGSGHFLVSLVDWLADRVLEATAAAAAERPGHVSPLIARLDAIAAHIGAEADAHGWTLPVGGLEPRQLVRRIILKRVIHGVDKNPMAVELAKLSLWLHTFTVGAPLSFLDHHLRCGDSLFGEWVRDAQDFLAARGGMMAGALTTGARQSARAMLAIEAMSDADIQEVHASADGFAGVEEATAPLNAMLSFIQAWRWLGAKSSPARGGGPPRSGGGGGPVERTPAAIFTALLDGGEGDTVAIARGQAEPRSDDARALAATLRAIATRENFLHWQVAFPNRWDAWQDKQPVGGFDAVIGNPPWDKMRFEEKPWFAARVPDIAFAPTAAAREKLIDQLKRSDATLWGQYKIAAQSAEAGMRVARASPTLGQGATGDFNIYALFAAQAQTLLKPTGIAGLLIPTGIATDKGSAAFFSNLADADRIASVVDFQNRPTRDSSLFFPDVYYRYKFCAFVFGGRARSFATAECAFFAPAASDGAIAGVTVAFEKGGFRALNPNTGTMPMFRTKRDAELTRAVYQRLPVWLDRRTNPPQPWPVWYVRMLDMANDSHLFRTRHELEETGFYPVAGDRWRGRQGDLVIEYTPLYEGKIVQAYNHRAASIKVSAENLHRSALPDPATPLELGDPAWLPQVQFHVPLSAVSPDDWSIALKDVTSVTNTRTVIAAAIPTRAAGHTLPLLALEDKQDRPLLLAMLNSFAFDYFARQKVQTNHVLLYILEQLPVIPPAAYTRQFGSKTAAEIVRADVLALTYTAHDMAPFARDLGYEGPPFAWNEADRRTRRTRLDALYFHLYGLGRDDADYIFSTFPIVERHDRAAHGRYLTRDLTLAWMNALTAGEPDAEITLPPA